MIEYAFDAGTSGGRQRGQRRFRVHRVSAGSDPPAADAHLAGYPTSLRVNGSPYTLLATPLARGPFSLFSRCCFRRSRRSAGAGLLVNLAAAQDTKGPGRYPGHGDVAVRPAVGPRTTPRATQSALCSPTWPSSAESPTCGNPLRRERRGERSPDPPVQPGRTARPGCVRDARKYRNTARRRMAVQFVGLSLLACGADPYLVPNWYLFVLTGAAVTWAGGRFIRPAGLAPRGSRGLLSGGRRVRVTALMSLALVLVLAGALILIAAALQNSEPAAVQAVDAADSGSVVAWAGRRLPVARHHPDGRAERSSPPCPPACGGRRVPPDAARYPATCPMPALVRR